MNVLGEVVGLLVEDGYFVVVMMWCQGGVVVLVYGLFGGGEMFCDCCVIDGLDFLVYKVCIKFMFVLELVGDDLVVICVVFE